MPELNGSTFQTLEDTLRRSLLLATLRMTVITLDNDPDVKFELFERLNRGSTALNAQELRNCLFFGEYNDLLKALAKNPYILKVMRSDRPHRRMHDLELILRFFAMWRNTHLKYKNPMSQFLNREMEAHGHAPKEELGRMRAVFERSIEIAWTVFGEHAFHRFRAGNGEEPNGSWDQRFNAALWDTVLYTFSFFEKSQIIPRADAIREELIDVMTEDEAFVHAITAGTDTSHRVRYRAESWRRRLEDMIGSAEQGRRCFARAGKRRLWDNDRRCRICGQEILDLDDAEVDHVKHWWRGGRTIPSNARLTHRYCNRARGPRA